MKKFTSFLVLTAVLYSIVPLSAQFSLDNNRGICRTFGENNEVTVTWKLVQQTPNGMEQPTAEITICNNSKTDIEGWALLVEPYEEIDQVYNATWNVIDEVHPPYKATSNVVDKAPFPISSVGFLSSLVDKPLPHYQRCFLVTPSPVANNGLIPANSTISIYYTIKMGLSFSEPYIPFFTCRNWMSYPVTPPVI